MADQRPSPGELWREAGGGGPHYSRERYRELLIEAGHLVPLAPGEEPEPLPCGWPGPSRGLTEDELLALYRELPPCACGQSPCMCHRLQQEVRGDG